MTEVTTPGDTELLERWQQGDDRSARALIERHFDSLYRFFRASVPNLAEDLVQDTWIACVKNRERIALTTSFRAYLLGIARNKVLMHWRTHGRRGPTADFDLASIEDLEPTPTQVLARTQHERSLLTALRQIPLEMQILLQLYYWEHLVGPELAALLGVPEGTVRGRLRRAKGLLAAALADQHLAFDELASIASIAGIADLDAWVASVRAHGPNIPDEPDEPDEP